MESQYANYVFSRGFEYLIETKIIDKKSPKGLGASIGSVITEKTKDGDERIPNQDTLNGFLLRCAQKYVSIVA